MDTIETETRQIHRLDVQAALEDYFGEEIPGKITSMHYPSLDRASDGMVDMTIAYGSSNGGADDRD